MDQLINGRYRILKALGMGAFGAVYLADDLHTHQKVVVKITNVNTDYERRAFKREQEVLARISNPNIVRLLDAGITEDGNSYIVTEYIEGRSLNELIETSGPLPLKQALEITLSISKGLSALHRVHILHRDIKPSNILIIDGRPDTAKLIDFGVIGRLDESSNLTKKGQIFGTPLYMAPEQATGSRQSRAADIYSLGITLYEMIYGRLPILGDSLSSHFANKLSTEIIFPEDNSIPQQVVSFMRRCLSISALGRPQSADEVIAEVSRLLEGLNEVPSDDKHLVVYKRTLLVPATIIVCVLITIAWINWRQSYQILGIVAGAVYAIAGIIIGRALHKWLKARRGEAQQEAGKLLLSSKSRTSLSMSLAIEVDSLICKVNRDDDKILATSLALMVQEFQEAKEAQYRQAAIMNVVQILEKLITRLSPWYVRHEKLIALTVTILGILSGITTVAKTIVDMTKGK